MTVSVRLFARARDLVGADTVVLDLPEEASVVDLREELLIQHPALESLIPHLLVAVGTDYVTDESIIPAGADLAVFPPVSGG